MTIYRLTKAEYQDAALTGAGSLHSGGRWHRSGTPIIYASDSPASALLEIIAHTDASTLLNHDYVLFSIALDPDRHLLTLPRERLPDDWRALRWPSTTQEIGTRWLQDQDSLVLEVPSVIIEHQNNYLINPQHAYFSDLEIAAPEQFGIDARLR